MSPVFLVTMAGATALIMMLMLMLVLVQLMGSQPLQICAALFVGAWIAQFFEDRQYLWVDPMFVRSRLIRCLGLGW